MCHNDYLNCVYNLSAVSTWKKKQKKENVERRETKLIEKIFSLYIFVFCFVSSSFYFGSLGSISLLSSIWLGNLGQEKRNFQLFSLHLWI